MKAEHWTTLAIVTSFAALATTGYAQDSGVIDFVNPSEDEIADLELLKKIKDTGMAILTWVVGPLIGAFTAFKGWQMIGNSQRGEKGPGVLVFICGIGMFALPKIITEIIKQINS